MPPSRKRSPSGPAENRVFNAILDGVLDHRLAPGTKLKERELAEIFGTSRGAVRNALNRLGHSLLVELRPNRGAIIANPSPAERHEVFEARRLIEGGLVQRLAVTLKPKQVAELRAFVAEESRSYAAGDDRGGKRLSIRFHKLLSELGGNATIDRFMQQLICRTPLLGRARSGRMAYCGAEEHRAIVEALARRDAAAAMHRMTAHLDKIERLVTVNDTPEDPPTLAALLRAA